MNDVCVVAYPADPRRKRRVWEGGGGPFLRLEVVLADRARVTIADGPGEDAVQILVIDANGQRLTDVTLRRGPSGDNGQ